MAEIAATGDVLCGESLRRKATPTALAATARGRRSHRYRGQHAAGTAAAREPCMEEIHVVGESCRLRGSPSPLAALVSLAARGAIIGKIGCGQGVCKL